MRFDPHIPSRLKEEFGDLERWQTRVVVLTFGVFSGLTVVGFTWLSDQALSMFHGLAGAVSQPGGHAIGTTSPREAAILTVVFAKKEPLSGS